MSRRAIALAALLACGLLTAGPAAQQRPVFRATTELVQVDVVVVDGDGNPVRGLKAADFQLFDRNQPQTIAVFNEISHDAPATVPAPMVMSQARPVLARADVADNRSGQSDLLAVLVVDDLHIYRGRTERAKELARGLVSQLGPRASMAVLFTSGNHSTQVTQDGQRLLDAIDTLKARQTFRRPHQATDSQLPPSFDPESDTLARIDQLSQANGNRLQDFFDNMTELRTLEDAAKMLGSEPARRKAFVVLSEGMAKDLTGDFRGGLTGCEVVTPDAPCYHDRALRMMMESLRRSNVAVYNIDPRGHVSSEQMALEMFPAPTGLLQSTGGTPSDDDAVFRWDNPVRLAQHGLEIMAEASGGFAVTNTDDFATGLRHVVEDLNHYYLLGFYPSDPQAKGYRPLDVKVPGHPDWTLRFRRGYLPNPPAPPANKDPLVALSAGLMPKADLPLRLGVIPLPGSGKTARLAVVLEVSAPVSRLMEADGKLRDDLKYRLLAVDEHKAKVASSSGHDGRLTLTPKVAVAELPETVSYQVEARLDVKPGHYQIRASAISTKLDKGGSVYLDVDVPDFGAAPLVVGGLTLGYAQGGRVLAAPAPVPAQAPARPRGRGRRPAPVERPALPFPPALDRTFARGDLLRVWFDVVRKHPGRDGRATIAVVDAGDQAVISSTAALPPDARSQVDLRLSLNGLDPGAYRLRVTATDGGNTASQEVGIAIR